MPYRGSPRGEPSGHLPPSAFVAFIQNHDQVGNRAFGDRLASFAAPEAVRAVAAVYLLLPQIPMIFMGEEYGASQPFPFFCDFNPELAEAVRTGRRNEFAKFPEFQDHEQRQRIPDPTSVETFMSAKLDWSALEQPEHRNWWVFYRELLAIRRAEIIPLIQDIKRAGNYEVIGSMAVRIAWKTSNGVLTLVANLKADAQSIVTQPPGRRLWCNFADQGALIPAWGVSWSLKVDASSRDLS